MNDVRKEPRRKDLLRELSSLKFIASVVRIIIYVITLLPGELITHPSFLDVRTWGLLARYLAWLLGPSCLAGYPQYGL